MKYNEADKYASADAVQFVKCNVIYVLVVTTTHILSITWIRVSAHCFINLCIPILLWPNYSYQIDENICLFSSWFYCGSSSLWIFISLWHTLFSAHYCDICFRNQITPGIVISRNTTVLICVPAKPRKPINFLQLSLWLERNVDGMTAFEME